MLTQEKKNEIIEEVLQNATQAPFSECELQFTVDNIEIILESTLTWIDGAMYREMSDFTNVEARKKLGLELLNMIIKERMK